jgi:hypothetical protein
LEALAAAQLKPTGTDSAVGLDYAGFNDEPIVGGGTNSDTEDPEHAANAGVLPRTAASQTAVTDDAANYILRRDSVRRTTIYLGSDGYAQFLEYPWRVSDFIINYRNSLNMICVLEGHSECVGLAGLFFKIKGFRFFSQLI